MTSPAEFNQNALEDSLKAYCNSFNATTDELLSDDERSEFYRRLAVTNKNSSKDGRSVQLSINVKDFI